MTSDTRSIWIFRLQLLLFSAGVWWYCKPANEARVHAALAHGWRVMKPYVKVASEPAFFWPDHLQRYLFADE